MSSRSEGRKYDWVWGVSDKRRGLGLPKDEQGNKTAYPSVNYQQGASLSVTLRKMVGWCVVLLGILSGMVVIAVLGGTFVGVHAWLAIFAATVMGGVPIATSLIAIRNPRKASRIDLWVAPVMLLFVPVWFSFWAVGGLLAAGTLFFGALVIPGFFWLLTSRHNWPLLVERRAHPGRFPLTVVLGSGVFCVSVLIGRLSSLFLPWWAPVGDCGGRPLLTEQGVPANIDFTAKVVFVGPLSFHGFSLWSVARVDERFAGVASWVPNLIFLRGHFRQADRFERYFVEGRRSDGAITRFLPIIEPVDCGRTAHIADAAVAIRALHNGSAVQFLQGTFSLITDVGSLPATVLRTFSQEGISGIANPGKAFRATDVIYDSSLPSRRLIFGGCSGDRCFVHYEQGGIGLSDVLALFSLTSDGKAQVIWQGYCPGAANTTDDLRGWLRNGRCSQSIDVALDNPKPDGKYDIQKCTPKVMSRAEHGESPQFHFRKGEKYLHSPVVACEILESGEIAHAFLKRSSGVADLDNYAVRWVQQLRYNKRPGCGVVESEVDVNIDFN